MTSSADLVLGLVLAVMSPTAAPSPAATPVSIVTRDMGEAATPESAVARGMGETAVTARPADGVDPAWTERVNDTVAKRWNVAPSGLQLEWGVLPPAGMPAASAPFRLLGGTDGWFVLSIDTGDGDIAAVRVRAGGADSVCVATRDLARGERLIAGDVRMASRIHWGAPRASREGARPSAGWELRRAVLAGTVIDSPTALPPALVNAGDAIALWWSRGEVALALNGVALHNARLGESVRVRVNGRPRPLIAIVDAPGRARIGSREAS